MPDTAIISDIQVTEDYAIHYQVYENKAMFWCFPVQHCKVEGVPYFFYKSMDKPSRYIPFDAIASKMDFSGEVFWLGSWEERVRFTDSEYWGSDLEEMAIVYKNFILPGCKERIKNYSANLRELNKVKEPV